MVFCALLHYLFCITYCVWCFLIVLCIVLHCPVLYHPLLYCDIIYYNLLYCILLYCTFMCSFYCHVLYYTFLYFSMLHFTALYCIDIYGNTRFLQTNDKSLYKTIQFYVHITQVIYTAPPHPSLSLVLLLFSALKSTLVRN